MRNDAIGKRVIPLKRGFSALLISCFEPNTSVASKLKRRFNQPTIFCREGIEKNRLTHIKFAWYVVFSQVIQQLSSTIKQLEL